MTERTVILGVSLLIVMLALSTMATLHQQHYKNRRHQMLEGRVEVIEKILRGEHD